MGLEETSIARQLLSKHVSATTPNNGTIERRCFLWVRPRLYNEDLRQLKEEKYKRLKLGGDQA
jgi:hypothetical protein